MRFAYFQHMDGKQKLSIRKGPYDLGSHNVDYSSDDCDGDQCLNYLALKSFSRFGITERAEWCGADRCVPFIFPCTFLSLRSKFSLILLFD